MVLAQSTLFSEDRSDPAARDELVRTYYPLAVHRARRYAGRGEPLDDLVQVASIGLLSAIERFDLERGVQFPSYAVPTIDGALKRHFRDKRWMVRVPRRLQESGRMVGIVMSDAYQELGRMPTVQETAVRAGMDEDAVLEAMEASRALWTESLDAAIDDDGQPASQRLVDSEDGFDVIEMRASVAGHLRKLPERLRLVLHYRFIEELTQSEVAEKVGVSQMHVSRLLVRALRMLRDLTESEPSSSSREPASAV